MNLESLEREMHSYNSKTNRVFKGIDAISSIIIRVPILMLFWIPIKVLKIIGLGDKLYMFIADRRGILRVNNCLDGKCMIKKVNQ